MIESYFKASLNFSRLKGTYLGKIHFNIIIIGASEKNEIEKWPHNFCSVYTVYHRIWVISVKLPRMHVKSGHCWPVSETPSESEWHFAGGSIVASNWILAGLTLGS